MATTTMRTVPPRTAVRNRFSQGFSWGLRALVSKELRGRSRGWRPVAVLTGYLLALAAGVAGFLGLAEQSTIGASPWLGLQLFSLLAFAAVLLLAFIPVSLTAGAISGERERRTLDLMLVTRASAVGLAAGKLVGSVLYVLFLLTASLPAFALVYLFGGVPARHIVLVLAVAGATALAHAALGLLLSAVLRRTIVASVAAYILVLGLLFGLPFAATLLRAGEQDSMEGRVFAVTGMTSSGWRAFSGRSDVFAGSGGPPPAFAYASPLVALSSVLPAGTSSSAMSWAGGNMGGAFAVTAILFDVGFGLFAGGSQPVGPPGENLVRAVYVEQDPTTGQLEPKEVWAPWVYYVAGSLVVAPLAVLFAAAFLAPQRWRRRRRMTVP